MTEKVWNKIQFFDQLQLKAVTPKNDSSQILENHDNQYNNNLFEKNNKIITGYENFCITKGITKLFPPKDFDFVGKHVVCQKCYQKFASRKSYKAHVDTEICVRSYNRPNLIYLKYKRKYKRKYKTIKNKGKMSQADLHNHDIKNTDLYNHDIKKNLLNPEILNTLQTRNNCYSDIVHQCIKSKKKQVNSSNKNDKPEVKRPRGRPKKIIEVESKKQGVRPKKLNIDDSSSQNDSSLDNIGNYETRIDGVCSPDDAYNNNNEAEKMKIAFSKMKFLTEKFQRIINNEWEVDNINGFQNSVGSNQVQCNKGGDEKIDISLKEREIIINIESLENDLNLLSKQLLGKNVYKDKLELMLSKLREKRNEYNKRQLKEPDVNNGFTTDKGKENIQRTIKKIADENEINKNIIDKDKNEKYVEVRLNNSNNERSAVSPTINDCEAPVNNDNYKGSFETPTKGMTSNCTDSVNNHMFNGLNYIINNPMECKVCGISFESIGEWKIHLSEHLLTYDSKFLCKICGLKFLAYKNFIKHMKNHRKIERKKKNSNRVKKHKNLKCGICHKQYNYLRSYFSHIKTHVK